MAKKKMKHYYKKDEASHSALVPQISGKAKSSKVKARPMIPGTMGKVYHSVPHKEKIPAACSAIDNDLALENMESDFDMTMADMQDFRGRME